MRLDALLNASRRMEGFVKARFIKHQGLFQKALDQSTQSLLTTSDRLFPSQQKQWEIE